MPEFTIEQIDALTEKVAVHLTTFEFQDSDDIPMYEDDDVDGKRRAHYYGAFPEFDQRARHWLLFKEPVDEDTALQTLKAYLAEAEL